MSNDPLKELDKRVSAAVAHYWESRSRQAKTQLKLGTRDQGARSAVTGGAQMDGFVQLFRDVAIHSGIDGSSIHLNRTIDLPGYYRPSKEWDMLIVDRGKLLAVIEAKSQVGPSFGNNFNNRTEEAMGSAHDLWTAFRESKFGDSPQPWVGYLFMIEDCEKSRRPVRVTESHFSVFPEFVGASYMKRYEIFCRKLVLERLYTCAAFVSSDAVEGRRGKYSLPSADLSVERFLLSMSAHLSGFRR